jgi:hypothetical protein
MYLLNVLLYFIVKSISIVFFQLYYIYDDMISQITKNTQNKLF